MSAPRDREAHWLSSLPPRLATESSLQGGPSRPTGEHTNEPQQNDRAHNCHDEAANQAGSPSDPNQGQDEAAGDGSCEPYQKIGPQPKSAAFEEKSSQQPGQQSDHGPGNHT